MIGGFKDADGISKHDINGGGGEEASQHLCTEVGQHPALVKSLPHGGRHGHGRIQMGSRQSGSAVNGYRHGQAPNDGDLKNTGLRTGRDGGRDTTAAKEDDEKGTDEFTNESSAEWFHSSNRGLFF